MSETLGPAATSSASESERGLAPSHRSSLALLPLLLVGLAPAEALAQPFVVTTEEASLVPFSADPDGGDVVDQHLGASVAISADASRLVLGGPYFRSAAGSIVAGRIAIYVRSGTSWSLESVRSGTQAMESFGSSVAMSADGQVVLAGAPGRDGGRGGASVYRYTVASGWVPDGTLVPSGVAASDGAGFSVALSGDGTRALVGSPSDDTTRGVDSGSVTVFRRGGSGWTEEATLVPSTGVAGGNFGVSVAISDSGAAGQMIVVGAVTRATGGNGLVYLHVRAGPTWTETGRLTDATGGSLDAFGTSVAIDAAATQILVGAPRASEALVEAGRVVHFALHGTEWRQDGVLVSPTATARALFGWSVSLSRDGRRALVGAPLELHADGTKPGSARLFLHSAATFAADALLVPSTESHFDQIGTAVALAGNGMRAVVGAPFDDPRISDDGSGSVFLLTTGLGAPCLLAGECGSGFCADGVCCSAACTRGTGTECQACVASQTGVAQGTCAPIVAGTMCAASTGSCDPVHLCDGTSVACPTAFLPVGTLCRAGSGVCDPEEQCDGGRDCPADVVAADGESCANADACDGAEVCSTGTCVLGAPLDCDDGDLCTADACDAVTGCTHDAVAACCNDDLDCDDASPCTDDTCSGPGGACAHLATCDAGAVEDAGTFEDAGVGGDAGETVDAAVALPDAALRDASAPDGAAADGAISGADGGVGPAAPTSGCGCRAGGARSPTAAAVLLALVALSWSSRRRRS